MVTTKNVSRHYLMSPGGPNHPHPHPHPTEKAGLLWSLLPLSRREYWSFGLDGGCGAGISRWDLRDKEMTSTIPEWTNPSQRSSPQLLSASLLEHSTCSKRTIRACLCWEIVTVRWQKITRGIQNALSLFRRLLMQSSPRVKV